MSTRRRFILGSLAAGGALLVGHAMLQPSRHRHANNEFASGGQAFLTTWLRIDSDNRLTVFVPHSEMGQGVLTALPMMAADEMDADWSRVRVEQAPVEDLFANGVLVEGFAADMGISVPRFLGGFADFASMKAAEIMNLQITGGSSSVRFTGEMGMRAAGAAARHMLISAAAGRWNVPRGECRAAMSRIHHDPSGRVLTYGELAGEAAAFEPPVEPVLKDASRFTLMGRAIRRVDIPAKVDGSARFGIDARPAADMLHAAVRNAPVFSSRLQGVGGRHPVHQRRGVRAIIELEDAVAVVADNYWRAQQAVDALQPQFSASDNDARSSRDIFETQARDLSAGPVNEDVATGDAEGALAAAASVLEAEYRVPFLAHAALEPMNCTVHFHDDGCEVWTGTQDNLGIRGQVADAAGLDETDVVVHPAYLGGGFGRRLPQSTNTIIQATRIARHFDVPVQTIWSREQDIRHDYYRPAVTSRFRGGLDAQGRVIAWENRYVGPNEPATAAHIPYAVANQQIDYVESAHHVPTGAWRSVAHSQHAFFLESFTDELAQRAERDPLQFRLDLLADKPRHTRVLQAAAERAEWGRARPQNRAAGIALQESFGSIVAEVAEVALDQEGQVRVERVVCAIDCGRTINPDIARAQVESGILFGLTATLHGRITIEEGRVQEANFDSYRMLQLRDSPPVEIILIESGEAPGGLGEPATPPIAPAVTNAVYRLTGQRVRELPLSSYRFRQAPTENPPA